MTASYKDSSFITASSTAAVLPASRRSVPGAWPASLVSSYCCPLSFIRQRYQPYGAASNLSFRSVVTLAVTIDRVQLNEVIGSHNTLVCVGRSGDEVPSWSCRFRCHGWRRSHDFWLEDSGLLCFEATVVTNCLRIHWVVAVFAWKNCPVIVGILRPQDPWLRYSPLIVVRVTSRIFRVIQSYYCGERNLCDLLMYSLRLWFCSHTWVERGRHSVSSRAWPSRRSRRQGQICC